MRAAAALLVTALLAGCATLGGQDPHVLPGAREVGGVLRVQAPIAYSQFRDRTLRAEMWTVNGPLLDAVYFYYDLRPGDALVREREGVELPVVRAGMAAHEVEEMLADTLRRTGTAQVSTDALRPDKVGTLDGFAFDFAYTAPDGLDYQGFARGAWHGERLVLVYFTAPRLHFYPRLAAPAQALFASIELL
jgi:hypothetical protein